MRRILFALLFSTAAFGQFPVAFTAANQCATIGALGKATVGIFVSGTFSATLQPQGSIQGQPAFNIQVAPSTSTTLQNTITTGGAYVGAIAGYSDFQICVSSYTSGTANVWLQVSENQLGSTIGGGGGGGATAFNAITSGTNTTAAMILGSGSSLSTTGTGLIALGSGSLGSPSLQFTAQSGAGLYYSSGQALWGDNNGLGGPLWGFSTTQNASVGSLYVVDTTGFFGFGPGDGSCTVCLVDDNTTGGLNTVGAGSTSAPFKALQYYTNSNCSATGTAANPSVVSCGAASAGVVYCDVAASAGTCVVNTTAAGTNSDITLTATASASARIAGGKTCNAAPTVVPAIPVAAISNGVSFTINVETGTVNGFCYFYNIVNK